MSLIRKIARQIWPGVLIAGVIAIMFVSCEEVSFFDERDEKEYRTEAEVNLPMGYVKTLNPIASSDEDTFFISKLIYDSLFVLDEEMVPQNSLAESYQFNKKEGTLTVDLADAKWHDGIPLTGRDVAFTVESYQGVGSNSPYSSLIQRIDYIEVTGDKQIVVHFDSKNRMSLNTLTFPIVPEHVFGEGKSPLEPEADFVPVGTGPYVCKSYNKTGKLVLEPNENYFGEKAENKVVFEIFPIRDTAKNLLEAGSISFMVSREADRETNIRKKGIEVVDFPSNQVEFLGYNFDRISKEDKDLRKAIACCVDNKRIIEECYFNSGMMNDSIFFPQYLGVDTSKESYPYDPDKAGDFLEKAGYTMDKDNLLKDEDGKALSLEIVVSSKEPARVEAAKIIEEDLQKMGIQVTLNALDEKAYKQALSSGNFDLFLGEFQFDAQMDMRDLLTNGAENYTGYSNDKVYDMLYAMHSGATVEEMKEIYSELYEILTDELPYYCVLYKTYGGIKAKTLEGEVTSTWDNYYKGCETWKSTYEVPVKEEPEKDKGKEKDKDKSKEKDKDKEKNKDKEK